MRFATHDDLQTVDAIVNDPRVMVWKSFEGSERVDVRPYFDPPSFVLLCEGGCFPALALNDNVYAVHINMLPECRGAKAIEAAKQATQFAFDHTDAQELWAFIPQCHPAAIWLARQAGFVHTHTVSNVWPSEYGLHELRVLKRRRTQ